MKELLHNERVSIELGVEDYKSDDDHRALSAIRNLYAGVWLLCKQVLWKDQYGDRETVTRYARCTIRSFVALGILKDSETKGCYEKVAPLSIADTNLAILTFESVLLVTPEGKATLGVLLNNLAYFPFKLPVMTGDFVSQRSDRIDVVRYGMDDELLKLKAR